MAQELLRGWQIRVQVKMGEKDQEHRIRKLEEEVDRLKKREESLMHDLEIYKQVFSHLKEQFEKMKKELTKR